MTTSLPDNFSPLCQRVVRKLRLPPGMTRDDALQGAYALAVKHHAAGKRDSHLFMRVWGDLKDTLGRLWREHYALTKPDRPVKGNGISRMVRSSGVEVDDLRRTGVGVSVIRNEPDESITIDVVAPAEADAGVVMDVRAAIEKLTPAQRHVVEECGLKGRSQADVAAERGVSVQAVKLLFLRARAALREHLKDYAE